MLFLLVSLDQVQLNILLLFLYFFSVTRQNISEKISQKNNIPTKIFYNKISHVNINSKFKPFYKSYIVITILIQ